MTDLYFLLQKIKARPEMYIGGAAPLRDLENLIQGYGLALNNHDTHERGNNFNQQFAEFLAATLGWPVNRGWARAFEEKLEKPQLLKGFFDQFELFIQHKSPAR